MQKEKQGLYLSSGAGFCSQSRWEKEERQARPLGKKIMGTTE